MARILRLDYDHATMAVQLTELWEGPPRAILSTGKLSPGGSALSMGCGAYVRAHCMGVPASASGHTIYLTGNGTYYYPSGDKIEYNLNGSTTLEIEWPTAYSYPDPTSAITSTLGPSVSVSVPSHVHVPTATFAGGTLKALSPHEYYSAVVARQNALAASLNTTYNATASYYDARTAYGTLGSAAVLFAPTITATTPYYNAATDSILCEPPKAIPHGFKAWKDKPDSSDDDTPWKYEVIAIKRYDWNDARMVHLPPLPEELTWASAELQNPEGLFWRAA